MSRIPWPLKVVAIPLAVVWIVAVTVITEAGYWLGRLLGRDW